MKKHDIAVPKGILALNEEQRNTKIQELKNTQKALESLDDHVIEALDGLYSLMRDDDKYVRLRAIEIVLKKVIPEKKIKQVVGPGGGPVQTQIKVDMRSIILNAAATLDSIDLEELTEASKNGSIQTISTNAGGTGAEED
jgi:hypothetical protein